MASAKVRHSRPVVYIWVVSFVIFCLSIPASCFDISEEREVGEKLLYSVRRAFTLIDDPDLSQYLTRLGAGVLDVAGIQYFDYNFFIIENKEFNAFAAPSGMIFFHSGLIGAMASEDELVSVLAHEIGHISKRHLASRLEKSKYSSLASLGLAAAAIAFGGQAAPALLTGALATGQSMNLYFSRQHEEEADLLAYAWMKEMGRDPEGQIAMLGSMRKIARYRSEKLPQYLLTHPNPEERMHLIESLRDSEIDLIKEKTESSDNTLFLRFKYRILAQVRNPRILRPYYGQLMAKKDIGEEERLMAAYGLALLDFKAGNLEKSLKSIDEVIKRYPDEPLFLADKGYILANAGKPESAKRYLKQAIKADARDMYASFLLGKILAEEGEVVGARDLFTTVMHELPLYSKVYYELGELAAKEGRQGLSNFYLGKFNLFEGRLQQAAFSLRLAKRDKDLAAEKKNESDELLDKIKRLQER